MCTLYMTMRLVEPPKSCAAVNLGGCTSSRHSHLYVFAGRCLIRDLGAILRPGLLLYRAWAYPAVHALNKPLSSPLKISISRDLT